MKIKLKLLGLVFTFFIVLFALFVTIAVILHVFNVSTLALMIVDLAKMLLFAFCIVAIVVLALKTSETT